MTRTALFAALVIAMVGCDSQRKGNLTDHPSPKEGGKIGGHAVRGTTIAYMADGAKVQSDSAVIFHVTDPNNAARNFWALIGSVQSADELVVPAVGGPSASGACIDLTSGYAFLIGTLPWLTSHLVNIASEGTTVYAEVFPVSGSTPERARVMLVNNPTGLPVHVTNNLSGQEVLLTAASTYVELTPPTGTSPSGISAINPFTPAITALVNDVKQAAVNAGIPAEP